MSLQSDRTRLVQVVAVARNGVIGVAGRLPWSVPSDLKVFKRLTLHKPIVMGRRTFEAIGRPLPHRTSYVVSRDVMFQPAGVLVFTDIDAAVEAARLEASGKGLEEVAIVGGGEIYRATRARTDRIYMTLVEAEPRGDAWFDPLEPHAWQLVDRIEIEPDPRDDHKATLLIYDRL
ncbi:MAG: dihydrofolate reductase [Hyphomicrobiaceae bacterium]